MGADPVDEAEWHLASVEARIVLAMRERAAGGRIDDLAMIRLFDELEAAIDRLRAVRDSTASKRSDAP